MAPVHVLLAEESHSTGHYLAAAAKAVGFPVSLDSRGCELPAMGRGDLLFYVDPGPRRLPIGIDLVQCARAAYLIDVHQDLQSRIDLAPLFDVLFVAQRDYVDEFRRRGYLNTRWLPFGCDPGVHYVPGLTRDIDVGFVGKLGAAGTPRHALLTSVLPRFRTNEFRRFYKPTEMGEVYSRSKIVLNASINGDVNMRVFEAMAAGALLVTDRIGNGLADLFVEGEHYVGYSSGQEALDRVAYFLNNTSAREKIAQTGRALVWARHTYAHRWAELKAAARRNGEIGRGSMPALSPQEMRLAYARILETRRDPAGLLRLMKREGISLQLGAHLMRAIGRAINARVPITPNAIRARIKAR